MALPLDTALSFDDNGVLATKIDFILYLVEKSNAQKVNFADGEETDNEPHSNINYEEHRSAEQLKQNIIEHDSQFCKRKIYQDGLEVGRLELDARDTDQVTENLLSDERNKNDFRCFEQATTDLGGDGGNFTDSGQRVEPSKPGAKETENDKFKGSGQRHEPSQPAVKENSNEKFKDTGQEAEPLKPDAKKTLIDTGQSTIISNNVKFGIKVESEFVRNKDLSEFATEHFVLNDSEIPKKLHNFKECNKEDNYHEDANNEHTYALWENSHYPDKGQSKGNPKGSNLRTTERKRQEIWSKKAWPFSSSKTSLTIKHWIPLITLDWIRTCTAYFFLGVLFLYFTGVEGTLTTVPLNTVVIRSQTARLTCTTNANQPVYWMRILTGSNDQQSLYYGNNGFNTMLVDDRFSIDKNEITGRYDLVIADVQPEDAGQYQCIDESGLGMSAAAELVVAGSMHCGTDSAMTGVVMAYNVFDIEQHNIQMTCNLTYKGNIAPSLNWSWPGSEKQREPPITTEASNSVTSKLKLFPTKELNNATFTCQATVNGAANRYNDDRLTWNSEPIFVGYAEFEQRAVPECPGINWNLICNPACSYTFVNTEVSGCQCQYTYHCELKDEIYRTTSENIACANGLNTIVPIVIAISAMCVCVVLGVHVLIFIKRKRIRERPNSEDKLLPGTVTEGSQRKLIHESVLKAGLRK